MRLVTFNNATWAIGFEWSTLASGTEKEEILSRASRKHNVVTIRGRQCGYGDARLSSVKGKTIRSLAACLEIPTDTFLSIFTFKDVTGKRVYWLFARINGLNIGLGDCVYEDLQEAQQAASDLSDLMLGRFDTIDEYLTFEETNEFLTAFCKLSFKDKYVENVGYVQILESYKSTESRLRLRSILVLVIILLMSYGGYEIYSYMDEHEMTERAKNARDEKKRKREEFLAHPELQFTMVWQGKPMPGELVGMCLDQLNGLPLMRDGWMLSRAECTPNSVSVNWRDTMYSRYDIFPDEKTKYSHGVGGKGLSASYVVPVVPVRDDSQEDFKQLTTIPMVERRFVQLQKDFRVVAAIKFKPAKTKSFDKETVVKCPWQEGNFSVHKIPHMFLYPVKRFFTTMNGVVVDSVVYDKQTFSISGRVFALPK